MAKKFSSGLRSVHCYTPVEIPPEKPAKNDGFLILLLLIVLLAASPSLGLDSSYFFVIILAIIGTGGVNAALGFTN